MSNINIRNSSAGLITAFDIIPIHRFATIEDFRIIVGPKNPPFFSNLSIGGCTNVLAFVDDCNQVQSPGQDVAFAAKITPHNDQTIAYVRRCGLHAFENQVWPVSRINDGGSLDVLLYKEHGQFDLYYQLCWRHINYRPNFDARSVPVQLHRSIGKKKSIVRFLCKEQNVEFAESLAASVMELICG